VDVSFCCPLFKMLTLLVVVSPFFPWFFFFLILCLVEYLRSIFAPLLYLANFPFQVVDSFWAINCFYQFLLLLLNHLIPLLFVFPTPLSFNNIYFESPFLFFLSFVNPYSTSRFYGQRSWVVPCGPGDSSDYLPPPFLS